MTGHSVHPRQEDVLNPTYASNRLLRTQLCNQYKELTVASAPAPHTLDNSHRIPAALYTSGRS